MTFHMKQNTHTHTFAALAHLNASLFEAHIAHQRQQDISESERLCTVRCTVGYFHVPEEMFVASASHHSNCNAGGGVK